MNQGGALVLSFVTRNNTQDSVSQLSGIIATSPCIRLTKPPIGIVRWLGARVRTILPNQNIPASVEPKVRLFISGYSGLPHSKVRDTVCPIQYLSHDPEVVKDNENDKLVRRSASLRAVDDMLSRVCQSSKVTFATLTQGCLGRECDYQGL
jgi:acylglycerol lipase